MDLVVDNTRMNDGIRQETIKAMAEAYGMLVGDITKSIEGVKMANGDEPELLTSVMATSFMYTIFNTANSFDGFYTAQLMTAFQVAVNQAAAIMGLSVDDLMDTPPTTQEIN